MTLGLHTRLGRFCGQVAVYGWQVGTKGGRCVGNLGDADKHYISTEKNCGGVSSGEVLRRRTKKGMRRRWRGRGRSRRRRTWKRRKKREDYKGMIKENMRGKDLRRKKKIKRKNVMIMKMIITMVMRMRGGAGG